MPFLSCFFTEGKFKDEEMGQFVKQTLEHFLRRAHEIHGELYDYSQTVYQGNRDNVMIICKEHGVFRQTPANHYKGNGCPLCGRKRSGHKTAQSIPSKYRGITYVPSRNKWRVSLFIDGKRKFFGNYRTEEEAHGVQLREWTKLYADIKVDDLDGEVWKKMDIFDGQYYVSNKGRFKTTDYKEMGYPSLLKTAINKCGYVDLRINGFNALAHRVVAEYFLGKSGKQINHKDGDRQNNYAENLEYVSNRSNVCHGFLIIGGRKYIGIHKTRSGKRYIAKIRIGDRSIGLGIFDTPEDAQERYLSALLEYGLVDEWNYIRGLLGIIS